MAGGQNSGGSGVSSFPALPGELRAQLILAEELGLISRTNFHQLLEQSVRVSQLLGGLIRSIQNGRTYRLEDRIK